MGAAQLERDEGGLNVVGPLVGLSAVMARLGLSAGHVYYHVAKGHLPAVRLGRRVMFDPRAVERFIANGGVGLSASHRTRPHGPPPWRRGRLRTTA